MSTDDLAAFLADRYDEAEALARAAIKALPPYALKPLRDRAGDKLPEALAAHIDLSDPAHRLADIALKRAILAEHQPYDCGEPAVQRCARCASDDAYPNGVAVMAAYPCATVRQLGAEFSKRPDYLAK